VPWAESKVGMESTIATARQTAEPAARSDGMEPPDISGEFDFFFESDVLYPATTLL